MSYGGSIVSMNTENVSMRFSEKQAFLVDLTEEDKRPDYEPNVTEYLRLGPDQWYEWMGESIEPVYDCKELESKFQEWQQSTNKASHERTH